MGATIRHPAISLRPDEASAMVTNPWCNGDRTVSSTAGTRPHDPAGGVTSQAPPRPVCCPPPATRHHDGPTTSRAVRCVVAAVRVAQRLTRRLVQRRTQKNRPRVARPRQPGSRRQASPSLSNTNRRLGARAKEGIHARRLWGEGAPSKRRTKMARIRFFIIDESVLFPPALFLFK